MPQQSPTRPVPGAGTGAGRRALTPELTARLDARLAAQQDFRVEQLAQLAHAGGGGRWGDAHPEIRASLACSARTVLGEVRAARGRIADGSFGRCTGCGSPIEIDRLELVPQTARCTDCPPPG